MINSKQFTGLTGQLKMFMSPDELMSLHSADVRTDEGETKSEMWDRKLDESRRADYSAMDVERGTSLYDDIKQHGIQNPAHVYYGEHGPELYDAHHRTAVAKAQGIELMPVYHNANETFDTYVTRRREGHTF